MHLRTVRSILGATALATSAVFAAGFVTAMGCGSSNNEDTSGGDSSTGDTAVGDVKLDTRDARPDTRDAHKDVIETGPDTNPEFDTTPGDIGPGDSSGLFPCGTETCNTLLQFCHVDPGCTVTPPPADTGVPDTGTGDVSTDETDADDGATSDGGAPDTTPADTGGGGDTGTCARHCETYADADASTCLGFPSCACIAAILCGSITNASCDDSSGGVTVSCKTP
jgi:hypothetical protein